MPRRKLFGRARPDEVKYRVVLLDKLVIVGEASDRVVRELEIEGRLVRPDRLDKFPASRTRFICYGH
jgi:hypothetical protein